MDKNNPVGGFLTCVKKKKRRFAFWHIIITLLCVIGVYLITRAIVCDCEKVTQNVYAMVLLCALWFLLLVVATVFTYLIIKSNSRYNAAINRLEILKVRLMLNEGNANSITDIDRELQLVARILETENFQLSTDIIH